MHYRNMTPRFRLSRNWLLSRQPLCPRKSLRPDRGLPRPRGRKLGVSVPLCRRAFMGEEDFRRRGSWHVDSVKSRRLVTFRKSEAGGAPSVLFPPADGGKAAHVSQDAPRYGRGPRRPPLFAEAEKKLPAGPGLFRYGRGVGGKKGDAK